MKEKLYTIPVNEAFDAPGECGFCVLNRKLEREILDYVMGPSYMEEDIREEMDRMGFCKDHYRQMFAAGNRLGVALMLQSRLKKVNKDTEKLFQKELRQAEGKKKAFGKDKEIPSPVAAYAQAAGESCYACHRMAHRMQSYIDTFFHLWKTEPEFQAKVKKGNGFCLEHLGLVLQEGKHRLKTQAYQEMAETLLALQSENMKRVEEDLDWFVQKFDYRFKDEPWKNAKDAVERGIQKIASVCLGEETT